MPVEQRGVGPVVWDRTKAGTAIKTHGYPGVGHHVNASSKATPCFSKFSVAFFASHSNAGVI